MFTFDSFKGTLRSVLVFLFYYVMIFNQKFFDFPPFKGWSLIPFPPNISSLRGLLTTDRMQQKWEYHKGPCAPPCSLWGHPSGRSQLPCHSDTSAALRRGPHGEELGPRPAATSVSGASLQMTTALANIRMEASRKTLSQNHAANPLPDAWPKETVREWVFAALSYQVWG